jgi:flavin reductase (DIM6/NTAB) family NADH-FMN oxidoreductase RutF
VIDPDSFRSVLGRFATGVTVVTTRDARGRDHGLT